MMLMDLLRHFLCPFIRDYSAIGYVSFIVSIVLTNALQFINQTDNQLLKLV